MALQPNCADVLHQILLCIRCHTVQSGGTATYILNLCTGASHGTGQLIHALV